MVSYHQILYTAREAHWRTAPSGAGRCIKRIQILRSFGKSGILTISIDQRKGTDTMLNIYFGDMPEAIYNTEVYFKNTYQDAWICDDFAKAVIKGVDKSEVIDKHLIKSPVLGMIPPMMLSGGTKTLLLIKNCPDLVFNASTCGDNCAKYIVKLAKERDITINLHHIMNFGKRFQARVLNDDVVVTDMEQLIILAARYV